MLTRFREGLYWAKPHRHGFSPWTIVRAWWVDADHNEVWEKVFPLLEPRSRATHGPKRGCTVSPCYYDASAAFVYPAMGSCLHERDNLPSLLGPGDSIKGER